MTPEEVEAVQASMARLADDVEAVADDFYRRLFADRPQLRSKFPDDLGLQRRKFADELAVVVESIPDFEAFRKRAEELGVRHRAYGVRPGHYAPVRRSLVAALAAADPGWDEATEQAWRGAYDLVAEVMQAAGAAR